MPSSHRLLTPTRPPRNASVQPNKEALPLRDPQEVADNALPDSDGTAFRRAHSRQSTSMEQRKPFTEARVWLLVVEGVVERWSQPLPLCSGTLVIRWVRQPSGGRASISFGRYGGGGRYCSSESTPDCARCRLPPVHRSIFGCSETQETVKTANEKNEREIDNPPLRQNNANVFIGCPHLSSSIFCASRSTREEILAVHVNANAK